MNWKCSGIALILSAAVALSGCSPQQAAAPQQADTGAPTPVQVETVKPGSVTNQAGISGKLAPNTEVKVSPKASGKIQSLNVTLGQRVTKGQVLFTLDQTDLANSVKQAEAAYQVALANLNQSGTNSSQGLAQAKSNLVQAEQALADAKRNAERMRQLYAQGAISSQQLEQANTALTNAETAYANAQTALAAAEKMPTVGVSEASVNQARVALQNAREQLANATVRAPISGYVSQVSGAVGEMASPQAPVVVIVSIDPLKVKVNLSEQEITTVKPGTKVTIELPALQKQVEASVTATSPVMDPQLKAYPVEISIPNPDRTLKPDMVVNVKFRDQANRQSLVVSRKAVFDEDGKRYVYKLTGDTVKKVEVATGEESSDLIEITKGLAKGDKVVVRGQTLLQDGAKVTVQTEN